MGTIETVTVEIRLPDGADQIIRRFESNDPKEIAWFMAETLRNWCIDHDVEIIINGGIKTLAEIDEHLLHVDGVMLGREAYHNPYLMAAFDARYYDDATPARSRAEVIEAMLPYISAQLEQGGPRLNSIVRHMLGLMAGLPGARGFRQRLSDAKQLASGDPELLRRAAEAMLPAAA